MKNIKTNSVSSAEDLKAKVFAYVKAWGTSHNPVTIDRLVQFIRGVVPNPDWKDPSFAASLIYAWEKRHAKS